MTSEVGLEPGTISITVNLLNHSTNQHSPVSIIVGYLNFVLFEKNGAKKMVAWETRTSDFLVFFNTKKNLKSTFT